MALIDHLSQAIETIFYQLYTDLPKGYSLDLALSKRVEFGDYQLNDAMKLAKVLCKPPRVIAQEIVEALEKDTHFQSIVSKVEVKGPGFINIFLDEKWLQEKINHAEGSNINRLNAHLLSPMIIDFSSPNIAKQMHVGHLRSTVIGDALSRIFEYLGVEVKRLNHIGDWGTSFGMLIAFLKKEKMSEDQLQEASLEELESWYKQARQHFQSDEAFKKASQLEVVQLQSKEPQAYKLWEIICKISEKAYREIYSLLDIKIEDRGESFYNPFLYKVVQYLRDKEMVVNSDGAECIFLEGFANRDGDPLPLIVQKSDGGFNYATTDLAAVEYRCNEDKAKRILYVTDSGQSTHFQMVFKAAEKAGLYDPGQVSLEHVPFGLVLREDGKKFRTREGETTRLIDLLNEAIKRASIVVERHSADLDEAQKKHLSKVLGLGSIKYADLSNNRTQNYTFSFDRMLQFEGNTLPYLMYSFVRTQGILRQKEKETVVSISIQEPTERALVIHLLRFEDVLMDISMDLLVNRLAEYLYDLSQLFNSFFRDCRVIGSDQESSRLALVSKAAATLKKGLNLLGIETVEFM